MGSGGHNRVPNSVKKKRGTMRKDRARKPRGDRKPFVDLAALSTELDSLERSCVEGFVRAMEAAGTAGRASPQFREAGGIVHALLLKSRIDPWSKATAVATLARTWVAIQTAAGLTPAAFDKVGAGDEEKKPDGRRVSLTLEEDGPGVQ